ncbi:divalent-cation tolerance protein CutA [Mangrovicoccus sp. HB161399]|uniref:divalent-cation tolerance protein CutA n=1 Tax=Mangrovicoccus sp. HB161399 TaxID=2720392 RepID=UPI0015536458|nr:divalent-cation tolerance protein CutA [Mangrovicoccus sp. HB161399]
MIVEIWINCPSEEVAVQLARGLMDMRLVASANRYPKIASRYFWKGRAVEAEEVPLLLKTRKELFGRVAEAARKLHPYETPSILCLDVAAANRDYADWVFAETVGADPAG